LQETSLPRQQKFAVGGQRRVKIKKTTIIIANRGRSRRRSGAPGPLMGVDSNQDAML
jgi:hypothetical protein